jgi:Zn-dependent protease
MLIEILSRAFSPQGLTQQDATSIVGLLIALVLGISVHEFSHALAATWLGDTIPSRDGRLTLAPAAHLDPLGSLMFLIAGFGWGRPVRYNPFALRASPRTGAALVALGGPLSNLILAALIAVPIRLMPFMLGTSASALARSTGAEGIVYDLLSSIVFFNIILAMFNLIPIPPLDGFSILLGILPAEMAEQFRQIEPWGMFLLLGLVLMSRYVDVLGMLLTGPVSILYLILVRLGS